MKYLKIMEAIECLPDLCMCLYFGMFYVNCDGRRRKRHVLQHIEKSSTHLIRDIKRLVCAWEQLRISSLWLAGSKSKPLLA